jgi:hypothetical protein
LCGGVRQLDWKLADLYPLLCHMKGLLYPGTNLLLYEVRPERRRR